MKLALILLFCAATTPLLANENADFPFRVGEKLTYQIFWGPFAAGRATLEVAGIDQIDGKDCYHLVGEAHTSGVVDLLYHIDSQIESWLDTTSLFTRQYQQARHEGKRRTADNSHYDYPASQVVVTNLVNGKLKTFPLTGPVQDVLSAFFYVRTQPLKLNQDQSFQINLTGKSYAVQMRPDARKTLYFRPTGDIPALRIEPRPTFGIVAANGGRMWFWVSDDARKLPLLMVSEIKFGSVKLVLTGIKPIPAVPAAQPPTDH